MAGPGASHEAAPAWLAALQAQANQPPVRERVPLRLGAPGWVCGSVEPGFARRLAALRQADGTPLLVDEAASPTPGWRVAGEPVASLALIAHGMRRLGLAAAWRGEQLAVHDEAGQWRATIERAAVRPLGIATHAVHLVGFAPDGRMWVQQRALDKPNDPGLWDTLMGGMVPAADSLAQALARETWEEAGLDVDALQGVRRAGRVTTRRPCADGAGSGYVIEHIDWFRCTVPGPLVPLNQDGEVAQFRLLHPADVLAGVANGEYTLEAALIIAQALAVPGATAQA